MRWWAAARFACRSCSLRSRAARPAGGFRCWLADSVEAFHEVVGGRPLCLPLLFASLTGR